MANHWHPLKAVDQAIKAFVDAAALTNLATVVRGKEYTDKATLPLLAIVSETGTRLRAKNWEVAGTLLLRTNLVVAPGGEATALAESDELESDLLDLFEVSVPDNDEPQALAAAIQAAGVAAAVLDANKVLIVNFMLKTITGGWDEDGNWSLTVDYAATVAYAQ